MEARFRYSGLHWSTIMPQICARSAHDYRRLGNCLYGSGPQPGHIFILLLYCEMTARPPPARPHIGLNPQTKFSSYSVNDWGEDDAWDSASDSESTSKPEWKRPSNAHASSSTTAPKPVPRPNLNNSSSTLAFSYTHVHAPSSYPPNGEQPSKHGWTIVRKSTDRGSMDSRDSVPQGQASGYDELDGDMVIGELESEVDDRSGTHTAKPRYDQGVLRDDAQEIVNGAPTPIACSH